MRASAWREARAPGIFGCLCGISLLALVACASAVKVDPNHGVSDASYRQVLQKGLANVVEVRAEVAAAFSGNRVPPANVQRALLFNLDSTAAMFSATLSGNGQ